MIQYFEQVSESVGKVFKQICDFLGSVFSNLSIPSDIFSEVLSMSIIFAIAILAISVMIILILIFVNAHLKKIDSSLREISEFLRFQK